MRLFLSLSLVSFLTATPSHAADGQLQRGSVPNWVTPSELMPVPADAAGLMFVRRHDTLVHLDRQGQAQYLGFRIRILHPNALQLGNISIAWNPSAGQPIVHAITVHRGGQPIDVLERATFEVLRREDQLEQASLDGILTAILRVEDLRVGDELEVAVTTRANDPTLGANDAGLLVLMPDPSPGRFRLGLSWDEGQEPNLKSTPEMAAVARRGERLVSFHFDNPPMMVPPKEAPPRYRWQRVVEYSDFSDWSAISRQFAPLFRKSATLNVNSPLKAEAARIAAAHPRPLDRARAALKLVQQEVRYIYVGLNGGNLKPATAEETWKRRYGDCKGKTALLLGLLAELGIDAEPVLVNNAGADDGLDERLPSPKMFDHVLVRARIDGAEYWLDGTLPPVAGPSWHPVMPYRWALALASQGKFIERLAWRPPQLPDEITLHEIDAREGFTQPARITHTTIVRGIKALQQQVQLSGLATAQLLAGMRQQLVGGIWQKIEDVRWHYDSKANASVLKISGTGTIDWEDDGGGARSLSLPGGGFNPPQRRVRPAEQDQDAPFYNDSKFDCSVTTVRLPKSTRPVHWSHNKGFHTQLFGRTYYRGFELRDGAIRMVRGSRVEQQEVEAATARRDNGKIAAFNNSMAMIYYDPADDRPARTASARVPATDEIDWTADDVPCLPSAAAGSTAALNESERPLSTQPIPTVAGANELNRLTSELPKPARYARLLNSADLSSAMHYPDEALVNEEEGRVLTWLLVGTDGKVERCGVEVSSGSQTLDTQTCSLLIANALFEPAKDQNGTAVRSIFNQSLTWELEDELDPAIVADAEELEGLEAELPKRTRKAKLLNGEKVAQSMDYPRKALVRRQTGTTTMLLLVGLEGTVERCAVANSSGSVTLDNQSCSLFIANAKFDPARDRRGRAVASVFQQRLSWRLQEESQVELKEWVNRLSAVVGPENEVRSCKAELFFNEQWIKTDATVCDEFLKRGSAILAAARKKSMLDDATVVIETWTVTSSERAIPEIGRRRGEVLIMLRSATARYDANGERTYCKVGESYGLPEFMQDVCVPGSVGGLPPRIPKAMEATDGLRMVSALYLQGERN